MTGDRLTTFFNTVLNAAYSRFVMTRYVASMSRHVGDDILIKVREEASYIDEVLTKAKEHNLRLETTKQIVSQRKGEFLRVMFDGKRAWGYPTRSILSLVMANWVNNTFDDKIQYLAKMRTAVWTLLNRANASVKLDFLTAAITRHVKSNPVLQLEGVDMRYYGEMLKPCNCVNNGPYLVLGAEKNLNFTFNIRVRVKETGKIKVGYAVERYFKDKGLARVAKVLGISDRAFKEAMALPTRVLDANTQISITNFGVQPVPVGRVSVLGQEHCTKKVKRYKGIYGDLSAAEMAGYLKKLGKQDRLRAISGVRYEGLVMRYTNCVGFLRPTKYSDAAFIAACYCNNVLVDTRLDANC